MTRADGSQYVIAAHTRRAARDERFDCGCTIPHVHAAFVPYEDFPDDEGDSVPHDLEWQSPSRLCPACGGTGRIKDGHHYMSIGVASMFDSEVRPPISIFAGSENEIDIGIQVLDQGFRDDDEPSHNPGVRVTGKGYQAKVQTSERETRQERINYLALFGHSSRAIAEDVGLKQSQAYRLAKPAAARRRELLAQLGLPTHRVTPERRGELEFLVRIGASLALEALDGPEAATARQELREAGLPAPEEILMQSIEALGVVLAA